MSWLDDAYGQANNWLGDYVNWYDRNLGPFVGLHNLTQMQQSDQDVQALKAQGVPWTDQRQLEARMRNPLAMMIMPANIKAYHGSPHNFPQEPGYPMGRFRDEKIGSGQGAQTYSRGHYFGEAEATGLSYRNDLSGPDFTRTKSGVSVSSDVQRLLQDAFNDAASQGIRNPSSNDAVFLARQNLDRQHAQALKSGDMNWYKWINDKVDELGKIEKDPLVFGGKMYEVNIRANPEDFLQWDKLLTQQSPSVKAALEKLWTDRGGKLEGREYPPFAAHSGATGESAQAAIETTFGSDAAKASQAMRDAGIPGIRYLDQGSRGAGEGTHNYVVFNPDIVDILRKYGLLPPLAGATGSMFGEQPQSP